MMPTVFAIVALILALVDEVQSSGRSLLGWAVVCVALALLWGRFA